MPPFCIPPGRDGEPGNRPGRPCSGPVGSPSSDSGAVAVDSERSEHDEQSDRPQQRLDDPAGGGSTDHEGAAGADGDAHRLVGGESLQPARHGRHRDEGRGGEGEREEDREGDDLGHLAVRGGQPDDREPPRKGVGEQEDDPDPGQVGEDTGGGTEPDEEPDDGDDDHGQDVPAQVGRGAAGQHRGPGHGQGPEPLDEALLQVLGQSDAGLHRAEGHRLHEDPRHQVVHVAGAGDVDGPAEHVAEQQHEHDGLHGGEEQGLGDPGVAEDVPLGDGQRVRDGPADPAADAVRVGSTGNGRGNDGGGHESSPVANGAALAASLVQSCPSASGPSAWDSVSSSVRRPVRAKNTSSRLGSRKVNVVGTIPAWSSERRPAMAASGPWSTVTSTTVPLTAGTWGPNAPMIWAVRSASSSEPRPTSRTGAPRLAFSWVGVPSAMTRPWSSTTRVSASRSASSRYWVVSRTVVPPPTSCSIPSHRSLRLCGSSPVVGSSRKSTVGRATRAAARSRRRRIPPEYVFKVRSPASARLNCANSSWARPATVDRRRWLRFPTIWRFSRPVRFSSTAAYWPASPMRLRTRLAFLATSCPSTRARPPSAFRMVVRMRTAVVFPDPFGPRRPKTVPSATEKLTPSRARTSSFPLKVFSSCSASIEYCIGGAILSGGTVWWGRGGTARPLMADQGRRRVLPAGTAGGPRVCVHSGLSSHLTGVTSDCGTPPEPAASVGADPRPEVLAGRFADPPAVASDHGKRRPGTGLRAPRRGRHAPEAERPGGLRAGSPVLLPGGDDLRLHPRELSFP